MNADKLDHLRSCCVKKQEFNEDKWTSGPLTGSNIKKIKKFKLEIGSLFYHIYESVSERIKERQNVTAFMIFQTNFSKLHWWQKHPPRDFYWFKRTNLSSKNSNKKEEEEEELITDKNYNYNKWASVVFFVKGDLSPALKKKGEKRMRVYIFTNMFSAHEKWMDVWMGIMAAYCFKF